MESDDAPIVLEETLTGHCESCLSNTELPQLLHVCHELLDGQTKIRHQLSDVSLNLGILMRQKQSRPPAQTYESVAEDYMEVKVTRTDPFSMRSVQLPKRNSVGLLPCHAKEQTPVSSKSLSSFRQIDACVDGSILRRGMTRKIMESASASVSRSFSSHNPEPSVSMKAPRRKSLVVPEGSPEAFSDISKAKVLSTEQEMSMSALFRDRETQLMPKTKTLTSNTKESPTMLTTTEGKEALMDGEPCWLRCWLLVVRFWIYAVALLPWTPCPAVEEDTWCSRCARRMSTSYRWFMILLNASTVCLIIFGCIAAPNAPSEWLGPGFGASGLLCLGALMVCLSAPSRSQESESEQEALMEYLENFMDITGLSMRWKQRQGRNALIAILLWLVVVGVKTWLMLDECSLSQVKVIEIVGYAIATACLSAMCYLQLTSWHGITMVIVWFAQSLLSGRWDVQTSRRNWREAVSLMRVTSRVYQRSFAVLLMTTLLVFFGALIDIGQGEVLPTLPSLVLAVALMSSSFMAASATAHSALEADQVPGSHHW